MTAMIGGADRASARLAATRGGWHRVAEHMPAAALYRATGHTGLVRSPGGFRAPSFGTDARFRAVDGTELAVSGAAGSKRTPLTTVRAAAEFAGVTPGTPVGVSGPAAPPGPALWPAHFDAGMTAAAISNAALPGDDHITDPYLYAGPHHGLPPGDPAFWNAPSGAARIFGQAGTVAEAAALSGDGLEWVLAHATTTATGRTS